MYDLISKLIIYKNIESNSILFKMADIFRSFSEKKYDRDRMVEDIYMQIHRLLDIATSYGFDKNLWHDYISFELAMCENPFTLVSEKVGAKDGSVNMFVRNDLKIFKAVFDYDFDEIQRELGIECFDVIMEYNAIVKSEQIFNKSVSEKVRFLSEELDKTTNEEEFYDVVINFYKKYGVGNIGLNKAFRITSSPNEKSVLEPVTSVGHMRLNDLIGYDIQKKKLIENTEAFVSGKPANNVLLYGDAGTGKSTCVKAILNEYYDKGLRMIEVYRHEFKYLSKIISEIKNRNYYFIIFMDDLSFEDFETEYKYLKAVIEGGLETKPLNVLIYATSNRRHLIRETWSDRTDRDDEMHRSDTVQEKLSLSARFGVTIGFYRPGADEFFEIVEGLVKKYPQIKLEEDELRAMATRWELSHGGRSGRLARQFTDYLMGVYGVDNQ